MSPRRSLLTVMILSLALSVVAPSIVMIAGRQDQPTGLGSYHGIPTRWYSSQSDNGSDCVGVKEDSIGLDFLNIERCLRSLGTGLRLYREDCPCDPFHRPYTYPPLMTLFFSWVFLMPTQAALGLWTLAVFCAIGALAYFWLGYWGTGVSSPERILTALLVTLSYPALFQYERGNHDVPVLFMAGLACGALTRARWFFAGLILAVAGMFKIYPLLLLLTLILAAALLIFDSGVRAAARAAFLRLSAGAVVGTVACVAPFYQGYVYYFSKTLPLLSRLVLTRPDNVHSHSLPAALGQWGLLLWMALWGAGGVVLCKTLHRHLSAGPSRATAAADRDMALIFVYLLGLTVYLAKTSYDYNLILWIPFFACYLSGGRENCSVWERLGVVLLGSGCFLVRWLQPVFAPDLPFSVYLALQVLGLIAWTAGAVLGPTDRRQAA